MTFDFVRPVFAGDTVECRVIITELREERGILNVASEWTCRNQRGKEVMNGRAAGFIRR